ncbi:hypothetical protein PIB30_091211 [Stylosanthes scabra]|uniref:Putative plant transposon protein domain-containing protein n=1 Tax=Stylosanthes scabra TaxID=79078 RepID=A0ABU6YS48_9FABA|nr:hypothetical protein [Stylosanthes scabra]
MASSSSTFLVFDAHRFRKAHNEQLFDSYARRRKVIQEVGFNLEDDEYPEIMEQIALRGWRRLAAPRTDISKLLVQEFYANAAVSNEEAAAQEELPYKSFVRGKEIDFSPNNIRSVMRIKRETVVPTGNKSEITTSRAILIDTIMQGEDVRAEEIIADNMETIAQGLASKGNLAHPSTIYKLCKDAGVPLREFARTPRTPSLRYITAKRMETIRFPRHQQPQQQEDEEEDEPMPQADGGNFEEEDHQPPQHDQQPQQHEIPSGLHGGGQANKGETRADLQPQPKEAYACWAQQQANLNLSEVPITQIPDIMRTNVEKGRPLFHGFLKFDYGASSSSQVDPEEPVPLRTAPPSPHFRPPYPPSN